MLNANQIINEIKNKQFKPIYFLMGDEPLFIDKITHELEKQVLTPDEKSFNQTIVYGKDTDWATVISHAKRYPMMAQNCLVVVKEAQHLSRTLEELLNYAQEPQPTTVLVINYKFKKLDARTKIYKTLKKNALIFESKKIYDNQIPQWIEEKVAELGLSIDNKAKFLLAECIGNDLNRLENEITKLKLITQTKQITTQHVEEHIGFSKDYNNFELQKALCYNDLPKALRIAQYFDNNTKNHPMVVSLAILYTFFSNLLIYQTLKDKTSGSVAKALGIHPFFVKDYQQAGRIFNLKKITHCISLLRLFDEKSKGINQKSDKNLHTELILRIL